MNARPLALAALLFSGAAFAGATISISGLEADGQRVSQLDCTMEGDVGLLGGAMVVSTIAGAKPALDACAPAGGAYEVSWTWAKDGATKAEVVKGEPAAGSDCVKKALSTIKAKNPGTCKSMVLVGEVAGADAALAKLKAAAAPKVEEKVEEEGTSEEEMLRALGYID